MSNYLCTTSRLFPTAKKPRLVAPSHPTSSKSHSPIYALNDDVLLNIIYLYKLHTGDEEDEGAPLVRGWNCQRWWYKLAQVSRRWRSIIFDSPSVLDLHLLCTYGVPVADMLVHSPPLPLTIFYENYRREMTTEDEESALLAISHRHRVRRIALRTAAPKLEKFIMAMDDQFPVLERLFIYSLTKEDTSSILPQGFQAPNLRHIHLCLVALPIRSLLLTSVVGLVFLWLGVFPESIHFTPNYILTRLSFLPHLETLGIGLYSPLPNLNVADTSTTAHVTLPNLRVFSFRGVSAYLEVLLSRLTAPILSTFQVQFFNQLTFTVPRLLQFMQSSENLNFRALELAFHKDFVDLKADPDQNGWKRPLHLLIMCRHFDWQVTSVVQIFGTLSPVLSVVERVRFTRAGLNRSSEWHNEVTRIHWRELLRPFSKVKVLQVEKELVEGISFSLRSMDGEPPLELLPSLEELRYSGRDFGDAFTPFVDERQVVGHPVRLALHVHLPSAPTATPALIPVTPTNIPIIS